MNKKFRSSLAMWFFYAVVMTIAGVRTAMTHELNGPSLVLFVIVTLFVLYTLIASLIKIFKSRGA